MRAFALLFASSSLAVRHPNPLGEGCLHTQFSNLNDGSKVTVPFDVSNPAVTNGLDINNPPSYLSLARNAVGSTFSTFVTSGSRCRSEPWGDYAGWAGECRKDVSEIRDALSVFGNIYPYAGGIYTKGDPWRMLQENITHEGYHMSGEYLDMFSVKYVNATTGEFLNQRQRDEMREELWKWWELFTATVGDGSKLVVPGGPTWTNFATLKGAVNTDGSVITDTNLVYTPRNMTRQFWGYGPSAKAGYGAYENLGHLMKTQFITAMDGLCGSVDCQYDRVIGFVDICRKSPGWFQGEWIEYGDHEEFHDLRKQLRSMWRTLSDYPQILPVTWYPYSIPNTNFLLFDIPAATYATVDVPSKGRQSLLKMLFRNDAATRTDLLAAGWPDGLIDLALAMALGGYYKQEQGISDEAIGQQTQWDFIQRFGYINNLFMEWKYGTDAGIDPVDLNARKTRINSLWASLKGWLQRNNLKELLHVAVDYLPWPTCDGPEGSTPSPTHTPTTPPPTTVDTTLAPTPSPTLHPTLPPSIRILPAQDSNLPIVIIDTSATTIGNETINARMLLYSHADGTVNSPSKDKAYDTALLVSISTGDRQQRAATRKRYFEITLMDKDINTEEKDYILFPGWGTEHSFVLEGPFADPSLMRSTLAYNLSRLSENWAPNSVFCELYIQEAGERYLDYSKNYNGIYLLRETVKRDGARVNIGRQDALQPPAQGGFLLALKHYTVEDGYWKLEYGGDVDVEYPTKSIRTPEMKDFMRNYLAEFEQMLFGPSWISQYRNWVGVPSFVDYFLLTEFLASSDAYLYNTYFDYDGKANSTVGKLHAGPIFSFEYSLGRVDPFFDRSPTWDGGSNDVEGWRYEARIKNRQGSDMSQWFGRFLGDPAFKGELQAKFATLKGTGVFSAPAVLAQIDQYHTELTRGNASARNWEMFPSPSGIPLSQAVNDLKAWVTARLSWMESALESDMFHTGVTHGSFCNVEQQPVVVGSLATTAATAAVGVSASVVKSASRKLLGLNCPLDCWGPYDGFPNCQPSMDWMTAHWTSDPKFRNGGVDGTTCSFQKFIYNENPSSPTCPDPCFADPVRDANGCDTQCLGPWLYYPKCGPNVNWVTANWRSSPKYAQGGVDGSRCSAQKFIHMENPGFCPAVCNPGCSTGDCKPPEDGTYPACSRDMQWVAANWERDSKFAKGGVNGSSCSIQDFIFNENATICPKSCQAAPTPVAPTATGSTPAPTPAVVPTPAPAPTTAATPTSVPTILPPSPASPTGPTKLVRSCRGTCFGPYPGYPGCQLNIEVMQRSNGPNNMTQCDYQLQLAARNICPALPVGLECRQDVFLCKQNPTAPTHSAPTPRAPTNQIVQAADEGGSGVGTFFAIFTVILAIAAMGFAYYQYRKRTGGGRWKFNLQNDQEPELLPYTQQLN